MSGPEDGMQMDKGGSGTSDAEHWASSARETAVAGSRDTYIVQLVVEPAGVADRVPVGIPSPERGSGGLTVCTGRSCSSSCRLGSGGGWGGEIKTNVKCVFRTTETDLKKLSLKSKLASGPHESKEDPQKQPQKEKYRRSTGRGVCQPAATWSEFGLLRSRVELGRIGKLMLSSESVSPSP